MNDLRVVGKEYTNIYTFLDVSIFLRVCTIFRKTKICLLVLETFVRAKKN